MGIWKLHSDHQEIRSLKTKVVYQFLIIEM